MLLPNQVIRADDLARAMVDIAIRANEEPGGMVLENRDIRARVETPKPNSLNAPREESRAGKGRRWVARFVSANGMVPAVLLPRQRRIWQGAPKTKELNCPHLVVSRS
jgi:hypothetical protein